MNDQQYSNFMVTIFKNLNPIIFPAQTTIFNELDDVEMVTYVMKGKYNVGYHINKQFQMRL